jgi:SAM-dependent methyltransferase
MRSGDMLVQGLGIRPGMQVLDLDCGDGTTALPAARLGAQVLGVDIASNLVRAGNRRVRDEGVANCRFVEGDAGDLQGIESRSFDLVVSIFGAMFASRPVDAAREMVRVTRRGGRIVMGNWIPGDPTLVAQILKTSAAYAPPPAGFVSPMSWGVEAHVVERFGAAGVAAGHIAFARETYVFETDRPVADFLAEFRHCYRPTMNAFAAAAGQGRAEALQQELLALFERENRSTSKDKTRIPATFLKVTANCP